ncbi:MFS transporter [Thermofilum pendens]|uniref:Major facilitator superfamily MFS_1 n=1 Tax=Thermofilum pendens (strain DSM 2475 / Hrk 5) TaxID=368408 RepID=A1S0E5_THEPD|nr:MFS transporter [Thermofilum pendens]ABL78925.1 major facilitator superfamily MFS_1 [Thermofilum pendens Hrk 5]
MSRKAETQSGERAEPRASTGGGRAEKVLVAYGLASSFAGNLVSPFMALYLYGLAGGRFFQAGIASQAPVAVSVIMGLFWARLSDTNGSRKKFVQLSLATGSLASLALSFASSINDAILVQILGAFTGSAGGAAFSALMAEVFKDKRGSRLGVYNASTVIGGFAGSMLSGFLYNWIGFRWMLRLNALLGVLPLVLISMIPEEGNRNPVSSRKLVSIPKIPRRFWKLYLARLVLSLPGALSGGVFSVYFVKYLNGPPEAWSTLVAVTTLFGLASIPYGRLADRLSTREMFVLAGLGWTALYLGYFLSPNYLVFSLFFVIPVWPAFWLAYSKALMDLSDESERATFYAFEGTLSALFGSAVGVAAGLVADLYSPRTLFLLSSASALLGAAVAGVLLR